MSQPAMDNLRTDAPGLPWAEQDARDRRSRLTELLARVSREANEGEDLEAVLRRIVDCLVERMPVALASIVLLNEACTHFVHEVWAGELTLNVLQPADDWPVSKGAAGRCARTGMAQLIPDVSQDPDYLAGNSEVRSEYLVPIRHRGRLHGVLNIESTQSDFFTPEACEVFDAIAAQVAGTIHLARVVREPFVVREKGSDTRQSMADGLGRHGGPALQAVRTPAEHRDALTALIGDNDVVVRVRCEYSYASCSGCDVSGDGLYADRRIDSAKLGSRGFQGVRRSCHDDDIHALFD